MLAGLIFLVRIQWATMTCSPGQVSNSMYESDVLRGGQGIVSADGLKMLFMGIDGALRLIEGQTTYWIATAPNPNNRFFVLQSDGNLVMYDACGLNICPVWDSGTPKGSSKNPSGNNPYHLILQNDKNLVLYDALGTPLWNSGTINTNILAGGQPSCLPCPAGTYSSAFGNLCSSCTAGTYSGVRIS